MLCKVCQASAKQVFTTKVLHKYDVAYYRCTECGFMQTDEPHWLGESYASAINEIDLGPVNRAITGSKLIEGVILSSLDPAGKFIDYGAGYGVLVRLMRDRGFDFYWQDLHCENLFAKQFVAKPGDKFELLTAFEVFEHLIDPVAELEAMVKFSNNLLFSTLLVPKGADKVTDWWYFGADHGQHIAFYTAAALEVLAKRFKLNLSTDGVGNHIMSQKPLSARQFRFFAAQTKLSSLARAALRRRLPKQSLLMDDFRAVSGYQV